MQLIITLLLREEKTQGETTTTMKTDNNSYCWVDIELVFRMIGRTSAIMVGSLSLLSSHLAHSQKIFKTGVFRQSGFLLTKLLAFRTSASTSMTDDLTT